MKNLNFSPNRHEFQNLGNETFFITSHENVKKFTFDWLAAKLCNKETIILWNVCTFERVWMNIKPGLFVC